MNKNKQRIAIAEACGWTAVRLSDTPGRIPCGRPPGDSQIAGSVGLPNYLSSLDAMHEAEKMCFYEGEVWSLYFRHLGRVCETGADDDNSPYTADATQRAEAFLKTLDLWVEETES